MDVQKIAGHVTVSAELLEDALPSFEEMIHRAQEADRAFRALPAAERERILTERKAAYEAQRCEHCGCHPDEHDDR